MCCLSILSLHCLPSVSSCCNFSTSVFCIKNLLNFTTNCKFSFSSQISNADRRM
ncbi:hypothetical protein RND81_05G022400 [Saponaria officinalis]|uniref:Uncharacterized protein n=1 Tax=Saponaria officinalis TaxID=3572 RepID=A0AAW1KUN5_SAPOF